MYSQLQWKGPLNYFLKIVSDERMQAEEIYSYENIGIISCANFYINISWSMRPFIISWFL